MPIECMLLKYAPVPLEECPKCGTRPFLPFVRGEVQRSRRWLGIGRRRPYCALICSMCKAIVGHETPWSSVELQELLLDLYRVAKRAEQLETYGLECEAGGLESSQLWIDLRMAIFYVEAALAAGFAKCKESHPSGAVKSRMNNTCRNT